MVNAVDTVDAGNAAEAVDAVEEMDAEMMEDPASVDPTLIRRGAHSAHL
jgi:hypothetical protein